MGWMRLLIGVSGEVQSHLLNHPTPKLCPTNNFVIQSTL